MDGATPSQFVKPSLDWLLDAVVDPECAFSLGAFGAVGQFPAEPRVNVDIREDRVVAVTATARISLSLCTNLQPRAFEMISADPEGWNHGIALCLPVESAFMSRRSRFTAIGPDGDALEPSERKVCAYDLGLGTRYADICVRPLETFTLDFLKPPADLTVAIETFLEKFHDAAWIFKTVLGRIETRHARRRHFIASLLSGRATHSNTAPIPDGMVPVGYLFPPLPNRLGTQNALGRHEAFQRLIDNFGDRPLARFKREVEQMLDLAQPPDALGRLLGRNRSPSRAQIACIRVALRQRRWTRKVRDRPDWERAFDRPLTQVPSPTPLGVEG